MKPEVGGDQYQPRGGTTLGMVRPPIEEAAKAPLTSIERPLMMPESPAIEQKAPIRLPVAENAPAIFPGATDVPNPPSRGKEFLSSLGRIGRTAGEIAGSALVPKLMPWIPGTPQNKAIEERQQQQRDLAGASEGRTKAETALETAETGAIPGKTAAEQETAQAAKERADAERYLQEHPELKSRPEIDAFLAKTGQRGEYDDSGNLVGVSKIPGFTTAAGKLTPQEQAIQDEATVNDPKTAPEDRAKARERLDAYTAALGIPASVQNSPQAISAAAAKARAEEAARENAIMDAQGSPESINAAAEKAGAEESARQKAELGSPGGQAGDKSIVDAIGTGKMPMGRSAYLLARNPQLVEAVTSAYPDFDASKVEAYSSIYRDFTSGKTANALNAGITAWKHLQELKDLNTDKSRIYGTADYQAYHNKLDTVSSELARFYGTDTIEGIRDIKSTLGSFFNRDAAIDTQMQSMRDKFDTYHNQWLSAAPSSHYEAPEPLQNMAKELQRKRGDEKEAGGASPTAAQPAGQTFDELKRKAGIK